jgi:hypothetical protein
LYVKKDRIEELSINLRVLLALLLNLFERFFNLAQLLYRKETPDLLLRLEFSVPLYIPGSFFCSLKNRRSA